VGQYLCTKKDIDEKTQQPRGCSREGKAWEICEASPGIKCDYENMGNETFQKEVDCKWTNGYSFETALILSIFLGMFGLDRFYLGYPAIGLLKFCTLGFFFIGHLVDIVLIASQAVGPADGSYYVISYFGAGLSTVMVTNETYRREQADWF
jgi:TM2 domain-containing membrane protein YozV